MSKIESNLFIEFFYLYDKRIVLYNGFSTCYNLCSDIISIEVRNSDPGYILKSLRDAITSKDYKNVYVTACHSWETFFIYTMAIEFPLVNFLIGGSGAVWESRTASFPVIPNFKLTTESIESIFPNFCERQWGLNIPDIVNDDSIKTVEFLMGSSLRDCTWGKCKFCIINTGFTHADSTKYIDIDFIKNVPKYLIKDKLVKIYLGYPDTTLEELDALLPVINYDDSIWYRFQMRSVKFKDLYKLKELFLKIKRTERIQISMGVEFLSNRMLKYMNKNREVKDYIGTINLLLDFKVNIKLNFILGWNNLTPQDVYELKEGMSQIDCSTIICMLSRFIIFDKFTEGNFGDDFKGLEKEKIPHNKQLYDTYIKAGVVMCPSTLTHHYILKDNDQIFLNKLAASIIEDSNINFIPNIAKF